MKIIIRFIIILGFILLSPGIYTFSQVAINNDDSNADSSAMLDVKSTNRGFLPPRIALTATNSASPVASPATGLLIFNTANAGTSPNNVTPGYYYWNGTRWISVALPQGTNPGDILYWNGTQWVGIPSGSPGQFLQLSASGIPVWSGAAYPAITTTTISSISVTNATSGGIITSDGGAAITARGVCWRTSANPTIADSKTTNGTGTGSFTSLITGLSPNTVYYLRAYATNSFGTGYGNEFSFTTLNPPAFIYSLIGDAFYKADGVTVNDWTYDLDFSYISTANNISTYKINNVELFTNGDFKIRISHDWAVSYGFTDLIFSGEPGNFIEDGVNVKVVSGKIYEISFIVDWSNNTHTLSFNILSPALTTSAVNSITPNSASCGGNITAQGNSPVTARGVCWNTSPNPTIVNSKTIDGTGTGTFTSSITGLTPSTTYYIRAYATNNAGTAYGNGISFTTLSVGSGVPILTTIAASSITFSTATSGGNINSDGGAAVTARGVCWSKSSNPTIADSKTTDGTGTGPFTSSITGLTLYTTYYVRAYATNNVGTGYGTEISFTTSAILSIGDSYQGGKVAYISQSGDPGYIVGETSGLIAAPSDQTNSIEWYNSSFTTTGATATELGTGNTNTTAIIINQGNTGSYAAKICRDYTGGGYNDWYLPSRDELNILYTNRAAIGGFSNLVYWSSSEINNNYALIQNWYNGGSNSGNLKSNQASVRAIRSFSSGAVMPTLTTTAASSITQNSATSGGTVTIDGGTIVTARGVCWSTSSNPTIADSKTIDGSGTGTFTSSITGITLGNIYYVRAYATNSVGTAYGNEINFTTTSMPTLTTTSVSSITSITAISGGNIAGDGGSTITVRGVCWSTSHNPIVTDNHTSDGSGTGAFSSSLTGLSINTIYYVRAYATNSIGTAYGIEISFTTYSGSTTDIDGNVYNTVTIGSQTWMAENLKTTKYNDGTGIPNITDNTTWAALTTGAYSDYSDTPSNSTTYGRLYNWYSVDNNATTKMASNGGKNVCPTGWHVPTDMEWTTLTNYLTDNGYGYQGSGNDIGKSMAAISGWHTSDEAGTVGNDQVSNNSSEFTALPGGIRSYNGSYYVLGQYGCWWSTTEYYPTVAWYRYILWDSAYVYPQSYGEQNGYSIRCLKD